jgi:hypothetical protein
MTFEPPPEPPTTTPAAEQAVEVRGQAAETVQSATDRSFSRSTIIALSVAGVLSLLATFLIPALTGDNSPGKATVDPNAYSYSALGHRAFVEFLRDSGLSVMVSRSRSVDRAAFDRPLILIEPGGFEAGELRDTIAKARLRNIPVVVFLPKREGVQDAENEEWVAKTSLIDMLETVTVYEEVVSGTYGEEVTIASPVLQVATPATDWDAETPIHTGPTAMPLQLLDDGERLVPIAQSSDGVLIGAVVGSEIYVISDPDIISTAGLAQGDNAAIVYGFFRDYLGAESLVVDELIHGFPPKSESIWVEMFSFPLIILTMHLLGLLAVILWATVGRFGKPEERPPRVAPGKKALIENTATLLSLGRDVGDGIRVYFRATIRAIAQAYAMPAGLSHDDRVTQLARLAKDRGLSEDLVALEQSVQQLANARNQRRRAVQLAQRVYQFREEMTHGQPNRL